MNKTRRRAVQKHRAKEVKFEERRKTQPDAARGRAMPAPAVQAPQRAKPAPRRKTAEAGADTPDL